MSIFKIIKVLVIFLIISFIQNGISYSQEIPKEFTNPILPGFHPDPSICRVGNDYYLVNSTFVWFPGIPIYHSKDLVNWELIGYGITRPEQVDFDGLIDKLGIFAVTIRYHEGTFYLITTCVNCNNNFFITSKDPSGPWSNPIWIEDASGIDASLMWDDDGKAYYTGQVWINEQAWPNQCGIWMQEIDLTNGKLIGKKKILTYGHANNAQWTEGPHLYRINNEYLLMHSEGGTGEYHSLIVHHSDSLWGPYITDNINPVLTHRHLGNKYPIQATGHGDLVQTQNGEWWCILLAKRQIDGYTTLGRETYLAKVEFQGKTPIFNPGYGKLLFKQDRPNLPWSPFPQKPSRDQFRSDNLDLKWNFIRVPKEKFYSLKNDKLVLNLRPFVLDSLINSSLIIQRIKHHKFEASTKMGFSTNKNNEEAGLVIYRTNENHYLLVKDDTQLKLIRHFKGTKETIASVAYNQKEVYLKVVANNLGIKFSYGESENSYKNIGGTQSLIVIADGNGNQFNGPGIGVYATSNGKSTNNSAKFEWFEYKSLK